MFTKVCVLLLAIGLSQAVRLPLLPESPMIKLMMRSSDTNQNDPQRSLSCFNEYLPLFNQANENFQAAYAKCLSDADASRAGIDESTKEERAQIDGSATSACQALDTCSKNSDSIEYFSCYSESGGENTKAMYEISANAAEWLAKVQEEYRLIDVNEFACTNKTQRDHVEESALIYQNFDRCLLGLEPLTTAPPTEEPSTAAPPEPTPEPSTAAPPEPTPEPSTAAPPEPTPEPSTAAPPEPTPEPSTAAPPEPTPEPSTAAPPEPTPEPSTAAPPEPTPEPSTAAPPEPTPEPSTAAPPEPTEEPSTAAPAESTPEPSTAAPAESTEEPNTSPETEPTAPNENMPEEDLSRLSKEQQRIKQMLDEIKNWFKRY